MSNDHTHPAATSRPFTAAVLGVMMAVAIAGTPASASHDGNITDACPPGEVPAAGFSDVPPGGTHAAAIDCIAWWEVAAGVGGNRYAPEGLVSRAAMASFVARTVEQSSYRLPPEPRDHFDDIDGSVHSRRINQLAEVGIVSGTAPRRYEPNRSVTRAQMASFLVRAYETATGTTLGASRDYFDDDQGSVHEENINKAAEAGFAVGIGPRRYNPSGEVRRDQMASFLARVLDTFVEHGHAQIPVAGVEQPPEPFESQQWALERIEARTAWERATGFGAVIAIVDTGIDPAHPEMQGRLVGGASWIDCEGRPPCDNWHDANGHGTHVAGIAAAPRDGVGIAGVAPGALLMPIRVLNELGDGVVEDVAAGIRYAADQGVDVINLSLGPDVVLSTLLGLAPYEDAIDYAVSRGILVVAAAGNQGLPLCDTPRFRHGDALCVGATDRSDRKTYYSDFGQGIDLVAPGGTGSPICNSPDDILSTFALEGRSPCTPPHPGYEFMAGTSMAVPHVAGVGALLAELGVRGVHAARRITATADDLGLAGYDLIYGHGRLNARAAVTFD